MSPQFPVMTGLAGNATAADGAGLARATPEEEMAAYDLLPDPVRAALASAAMQWSATNLLARWRSCAEVYGAEAATRRAVIEIVRSDGVSGAESPE